MMAVTESLQFHLSCLDKSGTMMTSRPHRLLISLLSLVCLPVFAQNIASVNGKPIPAARVESTVRQFTSQGQPDTPQLRAMIKDELINREILVQEAGKKQLDKTAAVREQMENMRQAILIRALKDDFLSKHPISEADMKAEYDRVKTLMGDKEYHARHILVNSEAEAKNIISQLNGGAKFEDLAKQSKDPGSAAKGGDLDWNSPAKFVQPFSDAMIKLSKGEITLVPVKSQFGYHVIKLEDVRPLQFPAYDDIKPRIEQNLQEKKLQAYQKSLREKAKVK